MSRFLRIFTKDLPVGSLNRINSIISLEKFMTNSINSLLFVNMLVGRPLRFKLCKDNLFGISVNSGYNIGSFNYYLLQTPHTLVYTALL